MQNVTTKIPPLRAVSRTAIGIGLAALVLAAGCAPAAGPRRLTVPRDRPPTIEEMASRSEYVVVGKIVGAESRWVGKKIITVSEVQPIRLIKGEPLAKNLHVLTLGGTVGVIAQHFSHEVLLEKEEVALLFLVRSLGRPFLPDALSPYPEYGKIPLLKPTDRASRLYNNRRLNRLVDEIVARVHKAGGS